MTAMAKIVQDGPVDIRAALSLLPRRGRELLRGMLEKDRVARLADTALARGLEVLTTLMRTAAERSIHAWDIRVLLDTLDRLPAPLSTSSVCFGESRSLCDTPSRFSTHGLFEFGPTESPLFVQEQRRLRSPN